MHVRGGYLFICIADSTVLKFQKKKKRFFFKSDSSAVSEVCEQRNICVSKIHGLYFGKYLFFPIYDTDNTDRLMF